MNEQRAAEKAGREITFPTNEQLVAEETEEPGIFTIFDAQGNIMRKVERPLRRGMSELTWDMRYLRRQVRPSLPEPIP
ncbi:MAG: hypothetical protein R2744_06790 [Bacteroidales bacterium]